MGMTQVQILRWMMRGLLDASQCMLILVTLLMASSANLVHAEKWGMIIQKPPTGFGTCTYLHERSWFAMWLSCIPAFRMMNMISYPRKDGGSANMEIYLSCKPPTSCGLGLPFWKVPIKRLFSGPKYMSECSSSYSKKFTGYRLLNV